MAINQETAVIKARMDRIPAALSPELVERISADRASGAVNPYRCNDDQVIRRIDRAADKGTLMRPAFMRDTEKILHLPAYTRYAGKTQVFSFRSNDDLSRRGLHVQLVSRIARDIGCALGLNCDLIEAIGLGHDLGHTPFGHAGERFLNDIYHERTGRYFFHNVQSVRVLDALYGRNVSLQTLDGVLCHNGEYEQRVFELSDMGSFDQFDQTVEDCIATGYSAIEHLRPMTLEGCVVRISDILAYVGRDRQDAIAAGLLSPDAFDDGRRRIIGIRHGAIALFEKEEDLIRIVQHGFFFDKAQGHIDVSICTNVGDASCDTLTKVKASTRDFTAMDKSDIAFFCKKEKAILKDIVDGPCKRIPHFDAFCRTAGPFHIFFDTHGHGLTA